MSYTRSAWKREYVFGDSHLYSFIGTDGNLWMICSSNEDGFDVIQKEDAFELVVSVLKRSGIDLDRKQLEKLAKELDVKLRKQGTGCEAEKKATGLGRIAGRHE
ncbi:hypothetical protein HYX06_00680 [Candidatus Woesearchaeota archaeon]|nr:hypothetical protein [Candidatus Woesearchaeota archaeon]